MAVTEDGADDVAGGCWFEDCFGEVGVSVVNYGFFFFFKVVTTAARNQELHQRAKEAPAPDLFLAVHGGHTVDKASGGGHVDGAGLWNEEGVLGCKKEHGMLGWSFGA